MEKIKKHKEKIFSIFLSLWIIFLCIQIVTFIPYFYRSQIVKNSLPYLLNLSKEEVYHNFYQIVCYLSIFHQGSLRLSDIHLSTQAATHFKDVKHLFTFMQLYLLIGIPIIIVMIRNLLKQGQFLFLKYTSKINVIIVLIVGIFALSNFNDAFVIMHKILFRNDFWLIDPKIDKVIILFPESYFNQLAIYLFIFILLFSLILYLFYRLMKGKLYEK